MRSSASSPEYKCYQTASKSISRAQLTRRRSVDHDLQHVCVFISGLCAKRFEVSWRAFVGGQPFVLAVIHDWFRLSLAPTLAAAVGSGAHSRC